MNGNFLLDTNVLIISLNMGLIFPKYKYLISVITEIELLSFSKLNKEEEKILREFIKNFEVKFINEEIKEKTISIRKKTFLKLPDSLIIATTIVNQATLITADKQILKYNNLVEMIDFNEIKIKNRRILI